MANLPRSTLDEVWRADLVSRLCAALLERYAAVAYTDVGEPPVLWAMPKWLEGAL